MKNLILVQSSNVEGYHWNKETQRLVAKFNNGSFYEYDAITSDVAAELVFADSPGKAFHALIRNPGIVGRKIDERIALGD